MKVKLPAKSKYQWLHNAADHMLQFLRLMGAGADLGFSRGGGRIFKKISKILTTFFFFRSTKLIFRALPKHCFAPILAKFSAPQANFWKKKVKKPFLGTFWKILTKKNRVFFGARSPSKLVYIGAKGAFRKILGSVGQQWISEKVSKGGPFGSAGGRIPEGEASAPLPPLNPPLDGSIY